MNKEIASLAKALSDENRLMILELLIKGETCGCTLIDKLPITQPTMSYHLRILTDSGLITSFKDGVWKKHHVNWEKLHQLVDYLTELQNMQAVCHND